MESRRRIWISRMCRTRLWVASLAFLPMAVLMAQSGSDLDRLGIGWAHPPIVVMPNQPNAGIPGFSPPLVSFAYGFTLLDNHGAGEKIAIVDAYDNPHAGGDLNTFDKQFGLKACTGSNGCFNKIYAQGTKPPVDTAWAGEISLDIEWAHAIAPDAKILLVEAADSSNASLLKAVDVAVQHGATVVSMSWGGSEYSMELADDSHFNVEGVTFVASSGDSGHGVSAPASSPFVVGVGGTTLKLALIGWAGETAWSGSGGGKSAYEPEPGYQEGVQTSGKRGVPDVAYDANPSSGVAVYSQTGFGGWAKVGGTSAGAPQWAALFAIANSMRIAAGAPRLTQPQIDLYNAGAFHDITQGNNGSCGSLCKARAGYDYVTGLGSPIANVLVPQLVAAP